MPIASFTLDHDGHVTSWSAEAADWFGYPAADVLGRHCGFLFPESALAEAPDRRVVPVTFRGGGLGEAVLSSSPLREPGGGLGWLCRLSDDEEAAGDDVQVAFTHALLRTSPFGLGVLDTDLRYVLVNDALAEFNGIPARDHIGRRVGEVVRAADGGEYENHLRKVLETGVPLHNVLIASRSQARRDRDRVWAVTFFRLVGTEGRVLGLGGLVVDVTQRESALLNAAAFRQRLTLVNQAGSRVGTTLEMSETARELAEFVVPEFADAATVEIRQDFPGGGPFPSPSAPVTTIRLAGRSVLTTTSGRTLFCDVGGELVHEVGSRAHDVLCTGRPYKEDAYEAESYVAAAERIPAARPPEGGQPPGAAGGFGTLGESGLGSLITAPLVARGRCLGLVRFGRSPEREPLDEDDLKVVEELAARAALSLDNARMYDEERRVAVGLQRNMLPDDADVTGRPGLEIANHYWSTSRSAKVGGDWFDVIPLSGHRVALVVGDMMGHDIQAAAGMGQLRTAMHTLARLDLEPVDLLTRLDDIVENSPAMQHATCVYAVYNTVTRHCGIANAGHPPPVLRYEDGTTRIVEVEPGVPLGIGLGRPDFAVVELELPENGTLVLYTDGLIERRGQDIEVGIEALRAALARPMPADLPLQRACDDLVARMTDRTGDDDLAVLMARAPAMPQHTFERWRLPSVLASVPAARARTRRTLRGWGLAGLADTAELLMSELVTNAVRHARGDIDIQLAKGETLVVEVADDDERLPHRVAATEWDVRGRGLTVVDEIAREWGARSVTSGKVVWFELPLTGG
jgi:serine phosphatase RsbU (regulator of sigma subunit)/PAS domain-containing protein